MRDDYAALDLFITASGKPGKLAKRKKLLGLSRRKGKKKPANSSLQGWPVALSWSAPRKDEGRLDLSAFAEPYSS